MKKETSGNSPSEHTDLVRDDRLNSWKELAAYLGREVRTVQLWEKAESLPVHRHLHQGRSSVYSYKSELDAWQKGRRPGLGGDLNNTEVSDQPAARSRWVIAAVVVVFVTTLASIAIWKLPAWRTRLEPGAPAIELQVARQGLGGSLPVHAWMPVSWSQEWPAGRHHSAATYDPGSDRFTMFGGFGGAFLNDTWLVELPSPGRGRPRWIPLNTEGPLPSARMSHSAAYDPASNRMLIFGGQDASQPFADVWILSNPNGRGGRPRWFQLRAEGAAPSARAYHSSVYDPVSGRLIVFGGAGASPGTFLSDVWLLENANGKGGPARWRRVAPTGGGPGGRRSHTAVYDSATDRMIVFGGFSDKPGDIPRANDVWVLADAARGKEPPQWTRLDVSSGDAPPARADHLSFYDTKQARLIVAMGTSGTENLTDVWFLMNANGLSGPPKWHRIPTTGLHPPQYSSSVGFFQTAQERLVLFGGQAAASGLHSGELWMLTELSALPEKLAEAFDGPQLDHDWYIASGHGTISLTENPGHLRYRIQPPASPPSLMLYRGFQGDSWTLEVRMGLFMGPTGGGRSVNFSLLFDENPADFLRGLKNGLVFMGHRDDWTGERPSTFSWQSYDDGRPVPAPDGITHAGNNDYRLRVTRLAREVTIELSRDGEPYQKVGSHKFTPRIDQAIQFLAITGSSFANFDSYADIDYIRLTPAPRFSGAAVGGGGR